MSWIYYQIENYSCWPVSLLNLFYYHWIQQIPETEYTLIEKVNAKPLIWCENEDLVRVLQEHLQEYFEITESNENWKLEDINYLIKKWNVVLVNYINAFSWVWHYSLITWKDEKAYYFFDSTLWNVRIPFHMF